MYILKNAMKNIRNSPVRNLLVGAIIVVISFICCMSLSLLKISDKAERDAMLNASATAKVTKGDLIDSIDTSSNLSYAEINKFMDSGYVYDLHLSASVDANLTGSTEKFALVGYSSEPAAEHFLLVDSVLLKGRWIDSSHSVKECIISTVFSRHYDCVIGDLISLELDGQIHEFVVSGFYKGNELNANNIITSFEVFQSTVVIDDDTDFASTFVFNDLDNVAPFREYVSRNSVDGAEYKVFFTGVQQLQDHFSPIKSTRSFALLSLILSLAVGGSILIVFSIFNIQERKYEVGVLTSAGMPKGKVVSQFISEILIITLFSVILGAAIGGPLSVITARSMLSPKMYTGLSYTLRTSLGLQVPGGRNIKIGYLPNENSDEDLLAVMDVNAKIADKLKAVMNIEIIVKVMSVGLLLTAISSLGSIIFVIRFKPLEILNDRN